MGRPWDESEVDAKANKALGPVESVIIDKRISPRHYSVFAEREGAWSLVRDGDRYRVQWSLDRRERGAVRRRPAGRRVPGRAAVRERRRPGLRAGRGDPGLAVAAGRAVRRPAGRVVRRRHHGDGREHRGGPVRRAGRQPGVRRRHPVRAARSAGRVRRPAVPPVPDRRRRMAGRRRDDEAGGRGYVLPKAISEYLRSGHMAEITPSDHPGLPPVTDAHAGRSSPQPGRLGVLRRPGRRPAVHRGHAAAGPAGRVQGRRRRPVHRRDYINEEYRPSPRRRGYPEPQTEFELVLGYVAAGWLPHYRILAAAMDAPFILETDGKGGLRVGVDATAAASLPCTRRRVTCHGTPSP